MDQIEVLKTIVELGSFRKAADSLHRAQSAVSYGIRKLEEELGFSVFDRSRHRAQLTPQGQAFYHKSKDVFHSFRELERYGKSLSQGCEPQVRLAVSALLPLKQVIQTLEQLKWRFPQTEVKLVIDVLGGDKLLLMDQVDLALTDVHGRDTQLESISLGKIPLIAVIGKGHGLLKKKGPYTQQDLKIYPQIILRSSPLAEGRSAGILNESNNWSVSEFASKKELLLAGLGWGYMPEHLIAAETKSGALVQILQEVHWSEIYLSKIKAKTVGPSTSFLWENLKNIKV